MERFGGLITGGFLLDACAGLGTTYPFHVFAIESIRPVIIGGGGSRPLAPGEIHTFFKPVHKYSTVYKKTKLLKIVGNLQEQNFERDLALTDSLIDSIQIKEMLNKTTLLTLNIEEIYTKL